MLSRIQPKWVWNQVGKLPPEARSNRVRHAFGPVPLYLRQDTGEVMLTRGEIAREFGRRPRDVSTIMGTFEKLHVLSRGRGPDAPYRGGGRVVHAHAAWSGNLEFRQQATAQGRAAVRGCRVMQGGASEP